MWGMPDRRGLKARCAKSPHERLPVSLQDFNRAKNCVVSGCYDILSMVVIMQGRCFETCELKKSPISVQRCSNGEEKEWAHIISNHKKIKNYCILEIVI